MAIKVQVKDNRGCESTFTSRTNNGSFSDRFGAAGWDMTSCTAAAGMGVSPLAAGLGLDACSVNGGMTPINSFAAMPQFQNVPFSAIGTYGVGGSFVPQSIVSRIATIDPAAAHLATHLMSIDPLFITNLSKVAGGCAWTAAKLVKVAALDFSLARQLVMLAQVNPTQALAIAATAEMNPALAARQLAAISSNLPMYGNPVHGLGLATGVNSVGQYSTIPVAVVEGGNAYIIEAELPGVVIENVDITATNGRLTLEAIVGPSASSRNGMSTIVREKLTPRSLRREFVIGTDVEMNNISARIADGILSIVLPKKVTTAEQALNREVSLV